MGLHYEMTPDEVATIIARVATDIHDFYGPTVGGEVVTSMSDEVGILSAKMKRGSLLVAATDAREMRERVIRKLDASELVAHLRK